MTEIHGFLAALGARLRAARQAAGLSVTAAAQAAGVSRRHWTETEAGRANPSVLVLARQAEAVRLPLPELVRLPRLGSGAGLEPGRMALVGLRGAGKSTVGRALARELELAFVELDQRVEDVAGLSLSEIFELHGSEVFHRFEAEALESVLAEGERVLIAAGGSIADRPDTFARLLDRCRSVWLKAAPEAHFQRVMDQGDRRPMRDNPRAMDELRALLARREPEYARCDISIDTTGLAPEEVVRAIVAGLSEERLLDASSARP